MPYQNISARLNDTDVQDIRDALATIQARLPFLVNLTVEERRKLFKMGNKSHAFVSNSLTAAQSNREILPASFSVDEFVSDYQLATALTEIYFGLQQLTEKVGCLYTCLTTSRPHPKSLSQSGRGTLISSPSPRWEKGLGAEGQFSGVLSI